MFLYQHARESDTCWRTLCATLGVEQKDASDSSLKPLSVHVALARTRLSAHISEQNFVMVRLDGLDVSTRLGNARVTSPRLVLNFDGNDIFSFSAPELNMLDGCDEVRRRRSGFPFLVSPHNRVWLFSCPALGVEFPYQYDFSSTFDKAVSTQKWLKSLHAPSPVRPERLPPDVVVRLDQFSFVFLDDVFEIKLRDNYELMKDESKESAKRLQLLDRKVAELRRQHGELLPARKIEELYASLERKHIEIYIQRSRRLYASTPMRKALLTWTVGRLELAALADPSLHGHERVRELLGQIDGVSPFPRDGLPLVVQWCRAVTFKLSTFLGECLAPLMMR